jgi:hypothetical protein
MEKLFVCPCCNGQVVHNPHGDEDLLFECLECESPGRVTKPHCAKHGISIPEQRDLSLGSDDE